MSKSIPLIGTCLLSLLLTTSGELFGADESGPKSTPAKTVKDPDAAAAWQRRIPQFQIENLPLGEIIKDLRHQFPEVNFVIKRQNDSDNYVSGTSVTMTLRAVTLQEILKAIELAADRLLEISGNPEERLVVFQKRSIDASGMPVDSPLATRVYNISSYLAQRPEAEAALALKEMEDVIHMAGAMLTQASSGARSFRPTLSVHPSTKLLIVVGRPEELALVEQVVTELQDREGKGARKAGAANAQTAGEIPGARKQ